jgi:tRNA threonylcarbamoyladenosine biosynthesis protein TsaE
MPPDVELRLTSPSPDTTRAVGAALAAHLRPGDVVVLAGELGAGKTCLVQGLAAALGHDDRVTSPTFLLARRLDTTPPVVHADAWRLDRVADVFDLGDELLDDDVVTVLEWGDALAAALPPDHLTVELRIAGDDHDDPRSVVVSGSGALAERVAAAGSALRAATGED